jgi:hypothetical protein
MLLLLEQNIKDLLTLDTQDGYDGDRFQKLNLLETKRNKLLLADEALWRQRSRINWIKCGDLNNKFFHRFASSSRNKKRIWNITDDAGIIHRGQRDIKATTSSYFNTLYEARPPATL